MFKKRHLNDINSIFLGGNISNFCNDSNPRAVSGRGVFTSSASCHPSPAAVFEMGDFVLYRDRSCVIHHIRQPIGTSKTFDITDVTKGELFVAYNYEVSHMRLEDALLECSFEMDETNQLNSPLNPRTTSSRTDLGKLRKQSWMILPIAALKKRPRNKHRGLYAQSDGRPHSCVVARPTTAPDAKPWSIPTTKWKMWHLTAGRVGSC